VVDAHGGTVAPGFNDSHVHFISGGMTLGDVDLAGLTTLAEVQDKIRAFAATHADAAWVEGRGWLYSPFPGGTPTREQLDAAVPDRPAVMTCYDGHSVWVNSKALALAGITKTLQSHQRARRQRPERASHGHLKESATGPAHKVMPKPTDADRRAACARPWRTRTSSASRACKTPAPASTSVALYQQRCAPANCRCGPGHVDLVQHDRGRSRPHGGDPQALGNDPTLTTGAVEDLRGWRDRERTAAMLAPHEHQTSGAPTCRPTNWTARGDGGQARMADLHPRHWRPGHPHVARRLRARRGRQPRAGEAGGIGSSTSRPLPRRTSRALESLASSSQQPMHVPLGDMNSEHPSGPWPDNVGAERYSRAWAWKSIQDAGGRLTFGSDWPVAPLDAGLGIWVVTTRKGPASEADQKLAMGEAIDGYTRWPAYASFEEQRKGTLAAGMLADIVVLAADVFTNPPLTVGDVVVDTTIFDGRVVYERPRVGR
jgi:hypothetical protein